MAGTVLVTGGTGYIAGELIKQLLARDWTVHTTVRSKAKSEAAVFQRFGVDAADPSGRLKVFEAELMSDAGWAEANAGCTHVAHVASPLSARAPKDENEMIVPAREGTLRALRFAKAAGVKRFVQTSSIAAISYGRTDREYTVTEKDWTDISSSTVTAYAKSKTIAERAARDWVAAEGGDIEFVSVNPVVVLGPVDSADFSPSVDLVKQLLSGKIPRAPDVGFGVVDTRDVAELHVRCLEQPGLAGERFIASGKFMKLIEIADVLRRGLGEQARKVPGKTMPSWILSVIALFNSDVRSIRDEVGKTRHSDASHALERLDWKTRPEEDSILDCARSLIAHGAIKF